MSDLIDRNLPSAETHDKRTETHACDCVSRQAAIDAFNCTDELIVSGSANAQNVTNYINKVIGKINALPSAQPDGWLEQNKDKILQAGMEGREIDFHIGGRLFAIREKAQ